MSRFALALALGVAAHVAPAQSPTPERLGDFYGAAARSPRLEAARQLARAAGARVATASRPPDPSVQLGVMNRNLPGLGPMPVLGMTQLQVMQMVPLRGKLALAGRVASAQASAAAARAEEAGWDVRSQVAMAFHDILATDRTLEVTRETLRLLQDIARTTEAMYRVGEGRQADVLRARVEIARMAEDTLRMQAMREGMVARLNAALDRESSTPVGALALPQFPAEVPTRAWLDSVATTSRAMVRAGEAEVKSSEAGEALARKELFPDLQVGVQYGQQRAMGADGMPAGGRAQMASLMVGASIPIFARSRQLEMRTEAEAMRRMAQADLATMRADTRGKIGEALASLTRARRLAQFYHGEILPQAEAAVASALAAYRNGSVDFMTLLDSRMRVNGYRQELATLDAEQGKAWAELEMLTGRELMDANRVALSGSRDATPTHTNSGAAQPAPGGAR